MTKKAALIEEFLMYGGPEAPESRATKADLERHIRERDTLLEALRAVLLATVANEFANKKAVEDAEIDKITSMSKEELTQKVGEPIPRRTMSEFCDKSSEVCKFVDKIGAHNVIHITSYRKGQYGQKYTVFYKE